MRRSVGTWAKLRFVVPKARFRRESWAGFQHSLDPLGEPRPLRSAGADSASPGEGAGEPPADVAPRTREHGEERTDAGALEGKH